MNNVRKISPSAPSYSLEEALKKAMQIYEAERLHRAPVDAVAKAMGYKNAKSGTAMKALATLKMFGLLESQGPGTVSITKSFQSYTLVPNEQARQNLLVEFVKKPKVFEEILSAHLDGLPSNETLKHMLVIEMGFIEKSAESVIRDFRKSIEFAGFYADDIRHSIEDIEEPNEIDAIDTENSPSTSQETEIMAVKTSTPAPSMTQVSDDYDTPSPPYTFFC